MSDKRAEILEWLEGQERLCAAAAPASLIFSSGVRVGPMLAALSAEVQAHKEQVHVMGNTPLGYCGQCDPVDEWPCLTIQRIHAATVGAA